jgi:exodeoxyribonuclease VII large subunit
VAVITSPTGAAVRDIVTTLARRFPAAEILLLPVRVQGPGSAEEIAAAIRAINKNTAALGGIDVIIAGRGGGSIEDLWAFNEEAVARAIFASTIPIISAVGHETDVTIADLVADVRAATPTAAAELVVPTAAEVLEELSYRQSQLHRTVQHQLALAASRLDSNRRRPAYTDPLLAVRDRSRRLAELHAATFNALAHRIHAAARRLGAIELTLQKLHPDRYCQSRRLLLLEQDHRLRLALTRRMTRAEQALSNTRHRLTEVSPTRVIASGRVALTTLARRLSAATSHALERGNQNLTAQQARLAALNHRQVLARGFSITRLRKTNKILRSPEKLKLGDHVVTELQQGSIESRVVDPNQPELFDE